MEFPKSVLGKKISKIWRGYAGVLFLELGELYEEKMSSSEGSYFSEKGEFTLMFEGEWFLFQSDKQLLSGLESSYEDIDHIAKKLVGLKLQSAQTDSVQSFILRIGGDYLLTISKSNQKQLTAFKKDKVVFEL